MSAASSSLISITTPSNSSSSKQPLNLQLQLKPTSISLSTPKTHFNFKPNYLNQLTLIQSSYNNAIQVEQTLESELSEIEEELENEEEEDESEPESPEAGKLYVGNLPYAITASELSQIFGEAGDVNAVEIVYDRVTDRSRGFAFITMASVHDAKDAIRMFNGSQIGG
ncbi:33 kDa ribonucleoprotein, chloroplastic-like [Bidens hawaiensis]|uniref:33 kDa ribonucleoprotein, chloroplastic-like n=1 Tax=Bidens hawaiensis TaxID=980011 RepID=UPI00404900F7